MNNSMMNKPVLSTDDLILTLRPLVKDLVASLRANAIPSDEKIILLQDLLEEYLSKINLSQMIEERLGKVQFEDCSGNGISDASIAADISRFQKTGKILFEFALRKLIAINDPIASKECTQWLIQRGYIAPVEIHSSFGDGEFLTLTSKGNLCFTRKKLLQKMKSDHDISTVPAGLRYFPEAWNTLSLCRAYLLQQYYERQGISDYLLFSAPKEKDTLLGCEISASAEIRYCFAWINKPASVENGQNHLREIAESPAVSGITVVFPWQKNKEEITAFVSSLPSNEKIDLYCLEVGENESTRSHSMCAKPCGAIT